MKHLELYSDCLICNAASYATATGLSAMIDGDVSHDQITRFLSAEKQSSKELWLKVKSVVREIEAEDGVLIFDDTIAEKEWTDQIGHGTVMWSDMIDFSPDTIYLESTRVTL